ncbi:Gfo/Idh/MocA family protein [Patulibacter americanus]|uniref:Gfo/Idh/MocA family protein n=1 Tax=Patulibacter americanus TaxID=588672 RepID=UPI0003B445BE|nr:Gfo/Idh/MocA family oxidoreductase [Patulibacter americanus]
MSVRAEPIGVAMLGAAFMGRAHAHALRILGGPAGPGGPGDAAPPRLEVLVGRDAERAATAAAGLGFARSTTDWQAAIADPAVHLFDDVGPNDQHAEPIIAAARAGKHVLCEKPLGRTADEAHAMWTAAHEAGVVHATAFNHRWLAAVRHAHDLIAAGRIGAVRHVRVRYLQDWLADPDAPWSWRLSRERSGSGVIGDLGSHLVDLCRHLVGEIDEVSALTRTWTTERPGGTVDVDDSVDATLTFAGGATGTLSASRVSHGRVNSLTLEITGESGTILFDLERLNELRLIVAGEPSTEQGLRTILVTDPGHPFLRDWWPPGHTLGWDVGFVHELHHVLQAIRTGEPITPLGADFEDGYRAAEVCDALVRSAAGGRPVRPVYRAVGA